MKRTCFLALLCVGCCRGADPIDDRGRDLWLMMTRHHVEVRRGVAFPDEIVIDDGLEQEVLRWSGTGWRRDREATERLHATTPTP